MHISQFVVPAEAYPRYNYARQHVVPLLKRFRYLTDKCNIADPFDIPQLTDPNIYTIFETDLENLNPQDIAPRKWCDIKRKGVDCKDPDDFKLQHPEQITSIYVASFKTAESNSTLWNYLGNVTVLISEAVEEIRSPEIKSIDNRIIYVKTKKTIATDISLLLERIVFRKLFERVTVLKAFLDLDNPQVLFPMLEQEIQLVLKKNLGTAGSSISVKKDVISLHNEWCNARFTAICNRISAEYGKGVLNVRKQLLHLDIDTEANEMKYPALKICEHIFPYLHGETMQTKAKDIPKSLLSDVDVMQKAQQKTRKAFILETRFKRHLECVHQHKDALDQLYGECMGMYRRSKVPVYEWPRSLPEIPPSLSEQVAQEILNVQGVKGCGYRFSTLDIYIKDTLTDEDRRLTEDLLKALTGINGISSYVVRTEQKTITQFLEISVGTKVTSTLERSASLGGFAKCGDNQQPSLLLARHLTDHEKRLFVHNSTGEKSEVALVPEPKNNFESDAPLDIAVAHVLQSVNNLNCEKQFKDHEGVALASDLIHFEENDIHWLKGLPVHIWGATSSPGLGTIIIPNYYIEGMKRLVKIEDRQLVDLEQSQPFGAMGDSGAIVCADDSDGEVIHVISMLMGSSNYEQTRRDHTAKGQYLTLRLDDGLRQLEWEHDTTFTLF